MVKLTSNQQYVVDERTVKIVTIDGTQLKGLSIKKLKFLFNQFLYLYRETILHNEMLKVIERL
jgi:hypothetical protein